MPKQRRFLFLLLISALIVHAAPSGYAIVPAPKFSARDEALLEDLERRSFQYFWDQGNPRTGLVLDRTRTDGSATVHSEIGALRIAYHAGKLRFANLCSVRFRRRF